MSVLKEYIRNLIESLQSHSREPEIGDAVVNINPSCKHHQSQGIVIKTRSLPGDAGKTATYQCTNSGPTWNVGDVLEKTLDQLELGS